MKKILIIIAALTYSVNAGICKTVDTKEGRHQTIIGTTTVKVKYMEDYNKLYFQGKLYTRTKSYGDSTWYKGNDGELNFIHNKGKILFFPEYSPLFYLYYDCN